jgi:hypothetical protein
MDALGGEEMKEGRIPGLKWQLLSHPNRKHGSVEVNIEIMVFYEVALCSLVGSQDIPVEPLTLSSL